MNFWYLFAGIVSLAVLTLWMKWLYTPSSSTWPQGYLRSTVLHGVTAFFLGLSIVFSMRFAESLSIPEDIIIGVATLPLLVFLLQSLLVLLVYAGVPAPFFFIPKWIREQDRTWRTLRKKAALSRATKRKTTQASKKIRQRKK